MERTLRFKFSILAGLVFVGCTQAVMADSHATGDVAALIKRQSQEFSDASASGNAVVLARLLDDHVTFMNENGDIGTKRDLVTNLAPAPKGASNTLVQTDWHIQLYGFVAVTAFTDESTFRFHGQVVRAKYRSTEVWAQKSDGWKMISSQTIALQDDPPAIVLPSTTLDEYVGRYTAGKGYDVAIARGATALTASVNGTAPVRWEAEVKDVFFVPGQPRLRRIFQRDASGAIVGFVSRREGHDIVLKREA